MLRRLIVQGRQTGEKETRSSRHSFESRKRRAAGPESLKKRSRPLDKALVEAKEKGWTVVDMKKDWKVI